MLENAHLETVLLDMFLIVQITALPVQQLPTQDAMLALMHQALQLALHAVIIFKKINLNEY